MGIIEPQRASGGYGVNVVIIAIGRGPPTSHRDGRENYNAVNLRDREIFRAGRFSTFATVSAISGNRDSFRHPGIAISLVLQEGGYEYFLTHSFCIQLRDSAAFPSFPASDARKSIRGAH
jgi:hypothetical protein